MILMMIIQLVDEGELDDGDSVSSGYVDVLTIIKLSTFQFFFSFCLFAPISIISHCKSSYDYSSSPTVFIDIFLL